MSAQLDFIPDAELDKALIQKSDCSLYDFLQITWRYVVVEPYIDGRHVHELCEHLQAVSEGHIQKLCINVPPGSTKSTIVCVVWPVWDWITIPERKFIFASYSLTNVRRDANKSINLLNSRWFKERWGTILDNPAPAATRVTTKAGGFRYGTSVRGQVTGEHGKIRVVDDPIKPLDALGGAQASPVKLEECINWYDATLGNRATDAEPIDVLIMQRLHENDLAAHILEDKDVVHLRLPMRFESDNPCRTVFKRTLPDGAIVDRTGGDWRTLDGELLCPGRWDEKACRDREKKLRTPQAIAAQEQQRPVPKGGLVVKKEWFSFWHPDGKAKTDPNGRPCLPLPPDSAGYQFQSWDLAFKDSQGSSRVAGATFWSNMPYIYIIDEDVSIKDFITSCADVLAMSARNPDASTKLVEDKANGPALENTLSHEVSGIELVDPRGSKQARFFAVVPQLKSGHYVLPHPELFEWVNEHIKELTGFPFYTYDDRVDVVSQALLWTETGYIGAFEKAMNRIHK